MRTHNTQRPCKGKNHLTFGHRTCDRAPLEKENRRKTFSTRWAPIAGCCGWSLRPVTPCKPTDNLIGRRVTKLCAHHSGSQRVLSESPNVQTCVTIFPPKPASCPITDWLRLVGKVGGRQAGRGGRKGIPRKTRCRAGCAVLRSPQYDSQGKKILSVW